MRDHHVMRVRLNSRLALAGAAVVVVMVALALALALTNLVAFRDPQVVGAFAQAVVPTLAIGLVGALIAYRLPSNRLGWILLTAGLVNSSTAVFSQYLVHTLIVSRGSLPAVEWVAAVNDILSGFTYPGLVVLIIVFFPDGRLLSARWRFLVWGDVLLTAFNLFTGLVDPTDLQSPGIPPVHNPTGLAMFHGLQQSALGTAPFFGAMLLLLFAIGSLVIRLRRARGEERLQVRWVVYALAVTIILNIALSLSSLFMTPSPGGRVIGNVVSNLLVVVGFGVAVPGAIGVAILKYRLYDIDLVINRTLVFGALAAFITAVYVGIVVGLGSLIGSQGRPNLVLSIIATAVVAVAFQPVRERVQRFANQLVYGKRATPYEVMADFSERMSETLSPDEVLPRMAEAAARGVAADAAMVAVRFPDGSQRAVWWPHPRAVQSLGYRAFVNYHEEMVGEIAVAKSAGAPVTSAEAKLLADLAAQAGLVLHNVRLMTELRARFDDLRAQAKAIEASRQRLVSAATSERKRLEQAIREGTASDLARIAQEISRVEPMLDQDPEGAAATLERLTGDVQQTLDGLRRLAHGLYPPLLRDKGLSAALQSQASREFSNITIDSQDLGRLPSEVEAAVYLCCLEAIRAAGGQGVLRMRRLAEAIQFSITGSLESLNGRKEDMEDRIEAIGGSLTIEENLLLGRVPLHAGVAGT